MKLNNLSIILIIVFSTMLIFSACSIDNVVSSNSNSNSKYGVNFGSISNSTGVDVKMLEFDSILELNKYLSRNNVGNYQTDNRYDVLVDSAVTSMVGSEGAAFSKSSYSAEDASDYSSTNVQYDSVDEADFIKNDAKYIYQILNNDLFIIDVSTREIVSTLELSKSDYYYYSVKNILLSGDNLVIFRTEYETFSKFNKYEIIPYNSQKEVSFADFYDISNRKKISKIRSVKLSGSYKDARLIDDTVYFISHEYANMNNVIMPYVDFDGVVSSPKISYFPNLYESSYNYNLVVSMDIKSGKVFDKKTLLLGSSNTLMVSSEGIYIAYSDNYNYCYACGDLDREIRFNDVIYPALPSNVRTDIDSIVGSSDSDIWWTSVSKILDSYFDDIGMYDILDNGGNYYYDFDNIDGSVLTDKQLVIFNIKNALDDYDLQKKLEREKTNLVRIEIDSGKFGDISYGSVKGKLLNQFSMDDDGNNLRVATNINVWSDNRVQYSNVYILDKSLNIVGSLEHLAENESIYSVRFMGNKLYLVTYEQVDPFFVIDLSNSNYPTVLGKLKIPGYSSYLHPLSNTLILGIGKDTYENKWGGTSEGGVKISLFDVSNFNKPVEVSKLILGDSGSYTPVQYDHKAFTDMSSENQFVLPIRIRKKLVGYNYDDWDGSYVISYKDDSLNVEAKLKSTVSSYSNTRYSYRYSDNVLRSLYFDNTIVTVSNSKLDFWNMDNDYKLLGVVDLTGDVFNNYDEEVVFDTEVLDVVKN